MGLPDSWSVALDRLARRLGGGREAEAWLREAVQALYGVESLHELDRTRRAIAFQKTCGVVLAVEETGWPEVVVAGATGRVTLWWPCGTIDFDPPPEEPELRPRRVRVAEIFARYFGGAALTGPPWRLSPLETDRPTYDEWAATADFG
jgi:hypothetical protein